MAENRNSQPPTQIRSISTTFNTFGEITTNVTDHIQHPLPSQFESTGVPIFIPSLSRALFQNSGLHNVEAYFASKAQHARHIQSGTGPQVCIEVLWFPPSMITPPVFHIHSSAEVQVKEELTLE